ncbi:MAG: hypothetical protein Q9227_009222 [Pyrenula ochraceoflavens]
MHGFFAVENLSYAHYDQSSASKPFERNDGNDDSSRSSHIVNESGFFEDKYSSSHDGCESAFAGESNNNTLWENSSFRQNTGYDENCRPTNEPCSNEVDDNNTGEDDEDFWAQWDNDQEEFASVARSGGQEEYGVGELEPTHEDSLENAQVTSELLVPSPDGKSSRMILVHGMTPSNPTDEPYIDSCTWILNRWNKRDERLAQRYQERQRRALEGNLPVPPKARAPLSDVSNA